MTLQRNNHGFTLIESLVYLALFAIVIGGGMVAAYQIIQATNTDYNHVVLQEEANFLLRKLNWALTGASSATANSSLAIANNSNQLTFAVGGSDMTLKRNSAPAIILNSSDVIVSNVSFTKTPGSNGKPDSVTVNFVLTTSQNGKEATDSFSLTKYLRQ